MRVVLECGENSVQLPDGDTTIGRDLSCRVRFNDPTVSRFHMLLRVSGTGVTVEDLKSKNGSRINDVPLVAEQQRAVDDQDVVHVGSRWFRIAIIHSDTYTDEDTLSSGLEDAAKGDRDEEDVPDVPLPQVDHHTCPQCRTDVPIGAAKCARCGFVWKGQRPLAITQSIELSQLDAEVVEQLRGHERRREVRLEIDVPVVYLSETLTFEATAWDLSSDGMFLSTELLDSPGTDCQVTVLPEGQRALTIAGKVIHVTQGSAGRPPGIGILFTKVGRRARQWLRATLRQHE